MLLLAAVACLASALMAAADARRADTRVRISRADALAAAPPGAEQCTLAQIAANTCLPTPSPSQARYQDSDFVALICYNMCTYAHNGDPGCDEGNWDVVAPYADGPSRDPATFKPTALNTSQWMESVVGLGASIAVLTAKHGCGFLLWNTSTTLPNGDPYIYHVPADYDVLRQFSDTMKAEGLGHVPPQPPTHPPTHQHSLMCRDISDKLLVCSGLLLQPDQQYVPRRS